MGVGLRVWKAARVFNRYCGSVAWKASLHGDLSSGTCATMVSLLLFVFLLQLLIHLVHTFGTDAVNSLVWWPPSAPSFAKS